MLLSCQALFGCTLAAQDGDIGRCKDFLFDHEKCAIRYMVADTGAWLSKQKVLVSPIALGGLEWQFKRIDVRLRKKEIESAPPLEQDSPVSRRFEKDYARYFGYLPYWKGERLWGAAPFPALLYGGIAPEPAAFEGAESDPKLRSMKEAIGYNVRASDDELGHVEDFIVSQENWKIQYMVVDTRNWLPNPSVIISTDWIEAVQWDEGMISMPLTKEQIQNAPPYDATIPVSREYEKRLYDLFGRPYYW